MDHVLSGVNSPQEASPQIVTFLVEKKRMGHKGEQHDGSIVAAAVR